MCVRNTKEGDMIVESLAGTGRDYVLAQATTRGYAPGTLHVQVKGETGSESTPKGNRAYGFATNVYPGAEALEFVKAQEGKNGVSLARTGKEYAEVQIRPRADVIHFQVNGEVVEEASEGEKLAVGILLTKGYTVVAPPPKAKGNREYGIAFDVPRAGNEAFWTFLSESIIFAQ
jgi:hypothetical protein